MRSIAPESDAKRLHAAAGLGSGDVTLHLSPDADHVLKHEEMPLEELIKAEVRAEVGLRYNADDRVLDPDAAAAIISWLIARTKGK